MICNTFGNLKFRFDTGSSLQDEGIIIQIYSQFSKTTTQKSFEITLLVYQFIRIGPVLFSYCFSFFPPHSLSLFPSFLLSIFLLPSSINDTQDVQTCRFRNTFSDLTGLLASHTGKLCSSNFTSEWGFIVEHFSVYLVVDVTTVYRDRNVTRIPW